MNILLIFPGFIIAFIIVFCYEYKIRNLSIKPKNNVHFYVARDKNETLWLYLNKPGRASRSFISSYNAVHSGGFESLGLNADDYKDLRWEDEPIEVFLNMED